MTAERTKDGTRERTKERTKDKTTERTKEWMNKTTLSWEEERKNLFPNKQEPHFIAVLSVGFISCL